MNYLKQVILLDTCEAFFMAAFFYKAVLHLGEKQGMPVGDECNSWYTKVGNFWYQFGIGEKNFCTALDQYL